jgi:hypothetical protein
MNALGLSAVKADGSYDIMGEIRIERSLAALLMAALAVIFYCTARLVLPPGWSALIALGGALGTQVWSTASRGMWSDTWGILLLGIVIYMLLAADTGERKLRPVLLASLLAWAYFARPTYSVQIFAVSVYILLYYRRAFIPYVVTGLFWLAGFIAYSWLHFRIVLPAYYRANRLSYETFWTALAGNLISPVRGVLLYVPVILFIAYLLARYRRFNQHRRLAWLALPLMLVHLLIISGFSPWWGGASYGSRFTTGLVPWFVLLGTLGVKAMLRWREGQRDVARLPAWRAELAAGALLLSLSIFINARGALAVETWNWFMIPDEDKVPQKLWAWREPQVLFGLVRPPAPDEFPLVETSTRIDFNRKESDKFLWYGWSGPEPDYRWSDGREATVVFALKEVGDMELHIRLSPMIIPGKINEQPLYLDLNGQRVQEFVLREGKPQRLSATLPAAGLRQNNILSFGLPNATPPSVLNLSPDQRRLGVAVEWMRLDPRPAAP